MTLGTWQADFGCQCHPLTTVRHRGGESGPGTSKSSKHTFPRLRLLQSEGRAELAIILR